MGFVPQPRSPCPARAGSGGTYRNAVGSQQRISSHTPGKLAARFQPLSKGNSSLGVFPVIGGGLQSGMVFGIRYRKINTAGTTAAQSHGSKVRIRQAPPQKVGISLESPSREVTATTRPEGNTSSGHAEVCRAHVGSKGLGRSSRLRET